MDYTLGSLSGMGYDAEKKFVCLEVSLKALVMARVNIDCNYYWKMLILINIQINHKDLHQNILTIDL